MTPPWRSRRFHRFLGKFHAAIHIIGVKPGGAFQESQGLPVLTDLLVKREEIVIEVCILLIQPLCAQVGLNRLGGLAGLRKEVPEVFIYGDPVLFLQLPHDGLPNRCSLAPLPGLIKQLGQLNLETQVARFNGCELLQNGGHLHPFTFGSVYVQQLL